MKILKTDKRLIDEGNRYKIEGDLISEESLDLTDLDKGLYVTGSIKARESIKAVWYIEAGGYIKAVWSIEAGWSIKSGRSIESGGFIKAGGFIEAGESIKAGGVIEAVWYIKAGEVIKSGRFIKAGESHGITAGLSITAKTSITAGLKIFAGVCVWHKITDAEKTITCTELLGGATVEYGILNIVEEEVLFKAGQLASGEYMNSTEREIITLNGKKYQLIGGEDE